MAVTEKQFSLAGHEVPVGSAVEIPEGLYQFNLEVPDHACEAHLQRSLDGRWLNVIGLLPDPSAPGGKTFRPPPVRLPAGSVRLEAPVSQYPVGIVATLTLIG
jgi:hypothetical protein